jgi:hypothetical protein
MLGSLLLELGSTIVSGGFVVEDPRVPFISNGISIEHGERRNCLAVWDIFFIDMEVHHESMESSAVHSSMEIWASDGDMGKPKPTLYHPPKSLGEVTPEEEVCRRFFSLLAKGAKTTIVHPPFLRRSSAHSLF